MSAKRLRLHGSMFTLCSMRGSVRLTPHDLRLTVSKGCGWRREHRNN